MTITTKLLTLLLFGLTSICGAQMVQYNYKRPLDNITEEWHKITLPNAVFGQLNPNLSDLRIYGITAKNDTIEAPYLLRVLSEEIAHKAIPFEMINQSKGEKGYYFTFQVDLETNINQIKLDFDEPNFDWKVDLQGSQNQKEWFTILDNYRILSIKNESTNYKFTTLNFPKSKYQFFRLLLMSDTKPRLSSAQISKHEILEGTRVSHNINTLEISENKALKTTIIDLQLQQAVSISAVDLNIGNTFDYYRPLKIEFKSDSVKTENGWKYNYRTIASSTLNSLEANRFKFPTTIAKDLRITIFNRDNQPLDINTVSVYGFEHQMIARFTEEADYMLFYGNTTARLPNYDISKFEAKVPMQLKAVKVGEQQMVIKPEQPKIKPLFEYKYWLWGIIGMVIILLGGFTLRMLRKV